MPELLLLLILIIDVGVCLNGEAHACEFEAGILACEQRRGVECGEYVNHQVGDGVFGLLNIFELRHYALGFNL